MLPALIATDVDGTLLNGSDRITARTREAILAAMAAGTQFVLATGRPPRWIAPVGRLLGLMCLARGWLPRLVW